MPSNSVRLWSEPGSQDPETPCAAHKAYAHSVPCHRKVHFTLQNDWWRHIDFEAALPSVLRGPNSGEWVGPAGSREAATNDRQIDRTAIAWMSVRPGNVNARTSEGNFSMPSKRTFARGFGAVAAGALALVTAVGAVAMMETPATAASPRAAENKIILTARQDPGTLDYVKSNLTALRRWSTSTRTAPCRPASPRSGTSAMTS